MSPARLPIPPPRLEDDGQYTPKSLEHARGYAYSSDLGVYIERGFQMQCGIFGAKVLGVDVNMLLLAYFKLRVLFIGALACAEDDV